MLLGFALSLVLQCVTVFTEHHTLVFVGNVFISTYWVIVLFAGGEASNNRWGRRERFDYWFLRIDRNRQRYALLYHEDIKEVR